MKGEKRDRQTAKQSCQPLGKLKIKKREEEKKDRQTAKQSCQPLGKLKIKKIEGGKEKEIKIYNKK